MSVSAAERLFFALWPDARARAQLARLGAEIAHHAHGRAPREDNLHLTLSFLGPVAVDRHAEAQAAGAQAAAVVDPFELVLERVGGNAYGVAWFTPDGMPPPLRLLHDTLAGVLEQTGFARERRMFRPHVTLARDCARAAHRGPLTPVAWTVDRLLLVSSTRVTDGPRYRELASWPLRGPS